MISFIWQLFLGLIGTAACIFALSILAVTIQSFIETVFNKK